MMEIRCLVKQRRKVSNVLKIETNYKYFTHFEIIHSINQKGFRSLRVIIAMFLLMFSDVEYLINFCLTGYYRLLTVLRVSLLELYRKL